MKTKSITMHGEIEIRDALRWIADILEGSQIQFVILGELVKQMVKEEPINVEKIEIGIKKNAWNETTRHLFNTFLPGECLKDTNLTADNGVPIELKIITRNYEFLKNPDFVYFWVDQYMIPNPWEKYYKARYLIK
jgi:hypothetical protein